VNRDPAAVAEAYFERMRARDARVIDLFHEDASLLGLGTRRSGREAIHAFYRNVIEQAGPVPTLAGPLLASGSRVAAEVYIALPSTTIHAMDLFVVEEGRIRSLTYFLASHGDGLAPQS
jgi:SnoaL-like domain